MFVTAYLEPELTEMLELVVDTRLPEDECVLVVTLCAEAIMFAREHDTVRVGQRARSAASLLLELTLPDLEPELRRELAVSCEFIAVAAAVRDKKD